MHGRLPYLAAKRKEPRALLRMEKQRRETMTAAVMRILDCGRSSKFEYEASCRHGLRSGFCLDGHAWAAADKLAGEIVAEALRRIGAVRPTWQQGQPEWTQFGFAPVKRYFCERCAKPIPEDRGSNNGLAVRFCSDRCAHAASEARSQRSGARVSVAEHLARCAARTQRTREERARYCAQCGKHFLTARKISVYCSPACQNAARRLSPRACAHCSAMFQPNYRAAKFCGMRCKVESQRAPKPPGFLCAPVAAE